MITPSCFGRLALPLLATSLLLGGGGCTNQKNAPPAETPLLTSAIVTATSKPAPAQNVVVSPNLSVSDEVAAACKLGFNDIDRAPRFDFDQSTLGPQDDEVLAQIAKCVTTGPLAGRALELVGRADPRGESEYNMALGERRASSVRDYLSRLGVDRVKLIESSRGKLDAMGTDENGWRRDRRVDILLQ